MDKLNRQFTKMMTTQTKNKPKKKKVQKKGEKVSVAPVTVSKSITNVRPNFKQQQDGIVITKREFCRSVTTAVSGFHIVPPSASIPGLDLNPANAILFPWLSTIAGSYEKYRFESVKFEFVSSVPTSFPGRLYVAFDYDYDDNVPNDKTAIMTNKTAADYPIWAGGVLRLDPQLLNNDMPWRYTSMNSRLNGIEPRTVYSGFLIVGVDQPTIVPQSVLAFDLWVTYTVRLKGEVGDQLTPFVANAAVQSINCPSSTVTPIPFSPITGQNFITTVQAGVNGVPLCGQAQGSTLFMLTPDRPDATLDMTIATKAGPGLPPNNVCQNTTTDMNVYSTSGSLLGALSLLVPTSSPSVSARNLSEWNIADGLMWLKQTVMYKDLMSAAPLATYLVPYLYNVAATRAFSLLADTSFKVL